MANPKKVTTVDVAKAAGVSQSTVSMILNGKRIPSFTDETVRRVLETADTLGYSSARREKKAPESDSSKLIMVFCPVLSNPYYTTVVQAIEQVAYAAGFRTVICTTYRSMEIELRHLSQAENDGVAGIVFTAIPMHVKIVEGISKRVPVVVIGDRNELINVDTVEVNSYHSGIAIAEYLIGLGHRSIAFLSTTLNDQNIIRQKRMEGVRDALSAAGPDCRFVVKSREVSTVESNADSAIEHKIGAELALECVSEQEVSALVAVNDMVAYGAMDALREAGLRIPQDYSICGFDNIFPSRLHGVQLTSVENFMVQKGENAMNLLAKRIRHRDCNSQGEHDSITRVEYQPRIIIRQSTAKLKNACLEGDDGSD